ncbi:MAG TPA: B-box zinc finger protein [Thermoanaerobaculia bacterium]
MPEPVLQYGYTCPSCSGSFTISLDRIPPVRARFPCAKCGEPMDFPSREQAQILAKLQLEAARRETAEAELEKAPPIDRGDKVFRVDKRGWEDDFLDRRAVRNLIRTAQILETDHMFTGEGKWVVAGELPDLKPLFDLKRKSKFTPPRCCRTHTDRVAHFFCRDSDRPLCEECAPEKKFGANVMRVCAHCGGTISDLVEPVSEQRR